MRGTPRYDTHCIVVSQAENAGNSLTQSRISDKKKHQNF